MAISYNSCQLFMLRGLSKVCVEVAFGLPAESCYGSFLLVNSFISADIILYPLIHYFLIIFAFSFD